MSTATRALFRCDGAQVPREMSRASWTHEIALLSAGDEENMRLGGFNESPSAVSALTGRAHDLFRIAAYAYIADQQISRGEVADVHHEKWHRTMALCVPVSDPSFWGRSDVTTTLERALGFATDDTWTFGFSHRSRQEPDQLPLIDETQQRASLAGSPDHVLLLSGGADSLCAAVQSLGHGRRPRFVSHRPSAAHDARQKRISRMIGNRFGFGLLPSTRFPVHRVGWEARESSQRSRAFLFASLGAAIAQENEITEVVLADNGVVSIGLPLHAGLTGALMSRTTHPHFIECFNELLDLVSPGIRVRNPLQPYTRSEVLSILKTYDCPELLRLTNSCSRIRNTGGKAEHCGYCSQCVDRRFGVIRAGLEQFELPDPYVLDIFTQRPDGFEQRTVPRAFVNRAKKIEALAKRKDGDGLFEEFPQLYTCQPKDRRAERTTTAMLVALLRHHAEDVHEAMNMMALRHFDGLYRDPSDEPGDVAQDSLLRLTLGNRPSELNQTPVIPTVIPDPAINGQASAPPKAERIFRRQDDGWLVSFEGVSKHIGHLDGMSYIAYLLSKPGADIRAIDLYGLLGPGRTVARTNGIHAREADEEGLRAVGPSREPVIEDLTRRQLGERLTEIGRERAQAERDRNSIVIAQLDAETAQISEYLTGATGLLGATRQIGAEEEHARDAVRSACSRARQRIGRRLPLLAQHLKDTVRIQFNCSYSPGYPTAWDVHL